MSHDIEFSPRGLPILTMQEKLEALAECIEQGWHEDACGHLCDLLWHEGQQITPSTREPFANLTELVEYYGQEPTRIKSGRTRDTEQ